MAQLVGRPTSAQVMIWQFVGSGPASGSVPTAWVLEPASDSVSPSLSASLSASLSLKIKLTLKKILKKKTEVITNSGPER